MNHAATSDSIGGSPPSVYTTGTFSVSGGENDTPRRGYRVQGNQHFQQQHLKPLNPSAIAFETRGSAASTPPPQPVMPNSIDQAPASWTATAPIQPTHFHGPQPVEGGPTLLSQMSVDPQQQDSVEREFMYTRSILPHVARPALVAVLASILDDFPQLAPMIRYRCDRAMSAVVAQQQQAAMLSSPSHGEMSPQAVTPPGQLPRRHSRGGGAGAAVVSSRHSRDDEVLEYCAVHGNMRPLKHLVFRPALGNYECIHGFHCLESSAPNSMSTTPVKEHQSHPHYLHPPAAVGPAPLGGSGTTAPSGRPAAPVSPSSVDLYHVSSSANHPSPAAPVPTMTVFSGGGGGWQQHAPAVTTSAPAQHDDLHGDDVAKLQSLLRSIRSIQDDGSV